MKGRGTGRLGVIMQCILATIPEYSLERKGPVPYDGYVEDFFVMALS